MKAIEITRAVYVPGEPANLVEFIFRVTSNGDLALEDCSPEVFDPMRNMDWFGGRGYVAELDYQKEQAYLLALEQMEAANES